MLDRIGNCRVLAEIGSGGMAVIYKAVQEPLNRPVAIKALKTTVSADPQLVARFEREARSVATLAHENIIHIYDFHKQDGNLFIVMEYVEGIDLYDLVDQCDRLPLDVAAIAMMQVARALDAAHYRGIVHRDIKPSNIMISKQGGVKLMDFGIARDSSMPDLTEAGTGLGTPSYMSPEQILGDRLDFRSDIFSLGVVLYQITTGRKPFVEDEQKTVMHKIRLEKYVSPRKINREIPRELERIMAKCMAKQPRDRYRSTQDLVLALERFIARRVDMNYSARLVLFLRSQGLLSEAEAETYLHPAVVGYDKSETAQAADLALWRVLRVSPMIMAAAAVLLFVVHLLPIGLPPEPKRPAPIAAFPPAGAQTHGYVQVVANPWAEVWIEGTKIETTPTARKLPVAAGFHTVEFRNPWLGVEKRRVLVTAHKTIFLRVDFDPHRQAPASAPPAAALAGPSSDQGPKAQ